MAGGANLPQEEGGIISDINVVPLVDITLVLLIIFMVATPIVMNQAIRVKLPKAAHGKAAMPTTVALTLKDDGQLFLNGQLTDYEKLRGQLASRVKQHKARSGDEGKVKLQAIIAADRKVPHGAVIHLIDVVKDCGVTEFALNIEKVDTVSLKPTP